MQSPRAYKSLACKKHPTEQIQGLISGDEHPPTIICFKCIMEETESISKMKVNSIDEYLNLASISYEKHSQCRKISERVAKEVSAIVKTENEAIEALTNHVNREKIKVNETLNTILENFIKAFNGLRDEIYRNLEAQPKKLQKLYDKLKYKIDRFYYQADKKVLNPSKKDLIEKANACKNSEELENMMRVIYEDIQEGIFLLKNPGRIKEIELEIQDLGASISAQRNNLPQSLLGTLVQNIESPMRLFKENVKTFLNTLSYVEPVIDEKIKSHSLISHILDDNTDRAQILEWVHESGYKKPFLLYRGSRDGFDAMSFHKFCDDYSPTLLIIKSNYGRVFGGFTDQTWNPTCTAKGSSFSWLFSLDEKTKFPIKKEYRYCAIFAKDDYGPTFGNAFDLYLASDFRSELNYSNLGRGYEAIGESELEDSCRLAGSYYFSIAEIEAYGFEDSEISI